MTTHKSSAGPLALVYAALIVYASLYPFTGWRDQGIAPWAFLASPWPRYWTGFDLIANAAGYAPLGFLLALTLLRAQPRWPAVGVALLASLLLSLLLEGLQSYLPVRVASNLDLALNGLGGGVGAGLASVTNRLGLLTRWDQLRSRWFVEPSRGVLALLALWPAALLFPAPVALGLGQVLERAEEALAVALSETPFLEWVPLREVDLQPLLPATEMLCVMLGGLVPCLLGFSVMRSPLRRVLMALLLLAAGVGSSALSAALSYGPAHAWAWVSGPVQAGLVAAAVGSLVLSMLGRRASLALVLLALVLHLSILNNAPTNAYFAQTLQTWEQGRFIRFHGLAQWLGWLWPFAVLSYALLRLSRRDREN